MRSGRGKGDGGNGEEGREREKRGKKRMKQMGKVSLSQEAFLSVLQR